MTTLDSWQEFVRGLELAEEMERQRPRLVKEYRLYYNEDGSIIGLWESSHPDGDNYVVIDDPDIFHRTNTNLLKVVNGELKIIDPSSINIRRLYKSNSGQRVVQGHAAVALGLDEEFLEIEYYDRKNS
jgi:hypothetical protein